MAANRITGTSPPAPTRFRSSNTADVHAGGEVSGADVAETTYTAFSGNDAMTVRLVVRRVRPTPGTQLALFTTWDYHAFVTNRPGDVLLVEADHRRHAVVEQRIASSRAPDSRICRLGSSWPTPPGSRWP